LGATVDASGGAIDRTMFVSTDTEWGKKYCAIANAIRDDCMADMAAGNNISDACLVLGTSWDTSYADNEVRVGTGPLPAYPADPKQNNSEEMGYSWFDLPILSDGEDLEAYINRRLEGQKMASAAVLQLLTCDDCRNENKLENVNTQTYVDENGNKGTLWCNPGPCTLGSALRHGWISGAGTFLPEELVDAATKVLMTDSETSSSAIRSEIFNITLKTIKEAAETSADPKLKSAAAMTTEQIKSKQVANEKSQEDRNDTPVVETEAPVGDHEPEMVVGMTPP